MKLRSLATALGLAAALQGTSGCYITWDDRDRPTPVPFTPDLPDPDDDPPTFTFSRSRGCAAVLNRSACGPDRPLLTGVSEAIRLTVPGHAVGPAPAVRVSNPEVIAAQAIRRTSDVGQPFEGVLEVRALRAGAADLRIEGADGRSWTYSLRVDDAAGMILVGDEGNPRFDEVEGTLQLRVGEQVSLTALPVNLNVERLYANDGVTWTAPDTRTVNLSWQLMSGARVIDDHVYVLGRAPGQVTLQVRAGVVERTVVVTVSE